MHLTEMRLDPLTEEWTLLSEARAHHPTAASVLHEPERSASTNPFLAGRESHTPPTLLQTPPEGPWRVRVIPNRAPVLRVEGDPHRQPEGFYDRMQGVGAHEVVIETPDHRALETLELSHLVEVVSAWKSRIQDLMRDTRLRSFTVVKAVGRPAGGLIPHALSQIIAMAMIPSRLRRKLEIARAFYEHKKRSIFHDILSEEVRSASRIVYENHGFMVFCPYASRTPFELAVYPKRQCPDFHTIPAEETAQLADALQSALRRLNAALDHPPYQLQLTTAPTRTARHDQWGSLDRDFRWHIEIMPRLYPLGPLELATDSWINSVWPETAAEYLRSLD
ncbi:MAG: UDP-glucose--galactose-phosphate uridylyltransferase, partial [Verrucomicrobiota bacterium]